MKKKIIKIVLGSSTLMTILFIVILIPVLMVMDFFGANITDDYVENNAEYSAQYKAVLNQELRKGNGYVPLTRIVYFYLANEKLSYVKIYEDNIDNDTKKLLPISEVCKKNNYAVLSVCKISDFDNSGQVNEEQNKPFSKPIDFSKVTVTSIFMENRIVFGKEDVHSAWDLAAANNTPVYSVCDGKVTKVSFTQKENVTNTSAGGGNQINISCQVDDIKYEVIYAHLYPNSAKVKVGDTVKASQQIAEVGTTGYSTGPHLHFQVKKDGNNVDGMSLIDFSSSQYNPIISSNQPSFNPNGNHYFPSN